MTQILKGDTFADGQQVTGSRLNQLIDSAQLLVGSITEQTALAAGTVESADQVNINDNSASALRKATVGDLLGSNVPVVTSSVTAGSASDITVTPNDGTIVAGNAYTSADGLTVVVTTSSAHGLSVGQVVLISGAASGYNGTFRLVLAAGTSFTYVMTTAATAGSGALSYTKKGTENINGNLAVIGNAYIDGEAKISSTLTVAGTTKLGPASATSLTIGGKTPLTEQDNGFRFYSKIGSATGAWNTTGEKIVYETPTLPLVPADETWIYEFFANFTGGNGDYAGNTRPVWGGLVGTLYKNASVLDTQTYTCGVWGSTYTTMFFRTTLTNADGANVKLYLKANNVLYSLWANPTYMVRLTKVKTASLSDASTYI